MDDAAARRRTLRMVPYALYLLGSRRARPEGPQDLHAYVVSWVTQCSFKPPMIAVAMQRESHGLELVRESRVFSLNVLAADQKALAQEFFREIERTDGRFASHPFERGARTGCPLFPELPAALECEVAEIVEGGGDHAVVVAHVVDAVHRREAKPLTHAETGWTYAG